MNRLMVIIVTILVLASCAKRHSYSREEFLALRAANDVARERVYHATQQDIFVATERVFKETDSDYTLVSQSETSAIYNRKWIVYLVLSVAMGQDYWKVTVTPAENGMKVEATHWPGPQGAGIIPIMNEGGSEANYTLHPIVYDFFHERLSYMLGERDTWPTCKEAERKLAESSWPNSYPLDSLCTFTKEKQNVSR